MPVKRPGRLKMRKVTLYSTRFYTGMDSQFVSTNVCLDSGCYVLTIYDFRFNSICCNGGQGGLTLLTENGDTISTGGQFGYLDTIQFCVNKTASLIADAQVQNATCGLAGGILNVKLLEVCHHTLIALTIFHL